MPEIHIDSVGSSESAVKTVVDYYYLKWSEKLPNLSEWIPEKHFEETKEDLLTMLSMLKFARNHDRYSKNENFSDTQKIQYLESLGNLVGIDVSGRFSKNFLDF